MLPFRQLHLTTVTWLSHKGLSGFTGISSMPNLALYSRAELIPEHDPESSQNMSGSCNFLYYILYYMILYYIILYTCRYKQKYTYMIVYVWIILDYVVFTYDISLHLHSVLILRTMSLHVVKSRRISHLWNRPMDVHPLKHTSWWKNRPTTQRWLISGKLLHNYGKIHHVQWENRLFRLGHVQ